MAIPANFIGAHKPIELEDYHRLAQRLGCGVPIVRAFFDVESSGSGFLKTGEPKILFEARYFHVLTRGLFDAVAPNVSSPTWDRSLYAGGVGEYRRLRIAMALDREAALKSCSIGASQIMGANHKMIGYPTIDEMWEAFCADEENHLFGFGEFVKAAGLADDMAADPPRFTILAATYNGAGYRANGYDQKLETAYVHYVWKPNGNLSSGELGIVDDPASAELPPASVTSIITRALRAGMTGADVKILQRALRVPADGVFGRRQTEPAVRAYQTARRLRVDGVAGPLTLTALGIVNDIARS